mmetsp:Transcript_46837/g.110258  ORF Transcript_46837/g.110258 Transcript_46837/m.110258 type:complete len:294 (+) Transcript_46837:544-1425(+)
MVSEEVVFEAECDAENPFLISQRLGGAQLSLEKLGMVEGKESCHSRHTLRRQVDLCRKGQGSLQLDLLHKTNRFHTRSLCSLDLVEELCRLFGRRRRVVLVRGVIEPSFDCRLVDILHSNFQSLPDVLHVFVCFLCKVDDLSNVEIIFVQHTQRRSLFESDDQCSLVSRTRRRVQRRSRFGLISFLRDFFSDFFEFSRIKTISLCLQNRVVHAVLPVICRYTLPHRENGCSQRHEVQVLGSLHSKRQRSSNSFLQSRERHSCGGCRACAFELTLAQRCIDLVCKRVLFLEACH